MKFTLGTKRAPGVSAARAAQDQLHRWRTPAIDNSPHTVLGQHASLVSISLNRTFVAHEQHIANTCGWGGHSVRFERCRDHLDPSMGIRSVSGAMPQKSELAASHTSDLGYMFMCEMWRSMISRNETFQNSHRDICFVVEAPGAKTVLLYPPTHLENSIKFVSPTIYFS